MNTLTSQDGTRIAYDRQGDGPPVVLVCGASVDRQSNAGLAAELAKAFTVYNFDRRGRGESGDTAPYAVQREIEDLMAVIEAAGGSAHLYGSSSGAALAMEAAAAGAPVQKLALWEAPYNVHGRPELPADTAGVFRELVESGARDEAVEFFMANVVGLPPDFLAGARQAPFWDATVKLAHTLAYDATIMGDYRIPVDRAKTVRVPTLVLDGGASFPFLRETADELARLIPDAERKILEGQEHNVDPTALAEALGQFFRD